MRLWTDDDSNTSLTDCFVGTRCFNSSNQGRKPPDSGGLQLAVWREQLNKYAPSPTYFVLSGANAVILTDRDCRSLPGTARSDAPRYRIAVKAFSTTFMRVAVPWRLTMRNR